MKILILFLFIASISSAHNKRIIRSPDKKDEAIVYNFSEKDITLESRVRIQNSKGKVILDTSFTSKDHEHGFSVIQAEWTANSEFFVFGMIDSGGHMPWQRFTFVYSVSAKKLININKEIEPVTAGFKLFPPDSIVTEGFKTNIFHTAKFGLHLSKLIEKNKN